jgi:hypothetical protein
VVAVILEIQGGGFTLLKIMNIILIFLILTLLPMAVVLIYASIASIVRGFNAGKRLGAAFEASALWAAVVLVVWIAVFINKIPLTL